jgi:hypothetical protein
MANERFIELINELYQATLDGRVRWEETTKEGVFRVGLGDGLVRIHSGLDDQNDFYVSVYLLNNQGRVVDELSNSEGGRHSGMLLDLYNRARSSALNIDKVVDSMLSDLKAGKVRQLPTETQAEDAPF